MNQGQVASACEPGAGEGAQEAGASEGAQEAGASERELRDQGDVTAC